MPSLALVRPAMRASAAAWFFAVLGCQPAVREERTISFSAGGSASFQHGKNGVFITDPITGKPKRIYDPRPEDIAFGPPTWDSTGKRMVFAVAQARDGQPQDRQADSPADGRRFLEVPANYSCWLYDSAIPGGKLEKLFDSTCSHVGAVAAGVAVQWQPNGDRLDYIEESGPRQQAIRTFDLATHASSNVPLPIAETIALGSSGDNPCRVALLAGAGEKSGLWIENSATATWWRVPDSSPPQSNLELLRRRLPKWSRDGAKLAFLDGATLRVCDVITQRTDTWFRANEKPAEANFWSERTWPLADAFWHPDGKQIGVIERNRLTLVGPAGSVRKIGDGSVLAFAGWDAAGKRMAYVVSEPLPHADSPWPVLLVPNFNAVTSLVATDAEGQTPPETLVSGVRATFPHWSRSDGRLSVWLTVEPPYVLAGGELFGMRPGDPAAVIDPDSKRIDFLPVNAAETAQLGHMDLRAGRIEAALKRFDEAAAIHPADVKADWFFFQAIALQKAGRLEDADRAWKRFEPPLPQNPLPGVGATEPVPMPNPMLAMAIASNPFQPRHRFAAEAFLSSNCLPQGIEFLRRELDDAKTASERLSASLVLGELLLIGERRREFAELVADRILPLASDVIPNAGPQRDAIRAAVAFTLLPLAASEFSAPLPAEISKKLLVKLAAFPAGNDDVDFAIQLVLRTLGNSLHDDAAMQKANLRIANHIARDRWICLQEKPDLDFPIDRAFLTRIRTLFLAARTMLEVLGR